MSYRSKKVSDILTIRERRTFMKRAVIGSVGLAATNGLPFNLSGEPRSIGKIGPKSETLVSTLYKSLSQEQKKVMAFPFDHPLRSQVDNNWQITPFKIKEFYTPDQQSMIKEIFQGIHNPAYVDKVMTHMKEDDGGLGNYTIAIFGLPGTGKFEFVLTGRHCTMRCDGDSVDGVAFGGPIFYGHAARGFTEAPDHPGNIYWYQAKSANQVFQALDGKQRKVALRGDPRREEKTQTVNLSKDIEGLAISEMSRDQKKLVEVVLADLLLPFRKSDAAEALRYIKKEGTLDGLSMSFYKNTDLGGDSIWDVWQLQSPNMIWFFRGSPHVHVWVNIKA